MRDLTLYIMGYCPYCHKVLNFMEGAGISIPVVDITKDKEAEVTLVAVGGKRQCPCLFIGDEPLYESDDIIAWLRENA